MSSPFSRLALPAVLAACLLTPTLASAISPAGEVAARVRARQVLRVCIWPAYYGITYRNPRTGQLRGIDIDLSAAFAKDLGVEVAYVDSSFATLIDDVSSDRCDVAMFGVGMLPQRMARLRFTRPYLRSDVYGITTKTNPVVRQWADIDRPGVRVGVQAGTVMVSMMQDRLKAAQVVVVTPPDTRERELEAGRVDVFMTDFAYSRRLLDLADWAALVTPDRPLPMPPCAYAVKPGDDAWWATVDAFVQRARDDGRLDEAARRHGLAPIVLR